MTMKPRMEVQDASLPLPLNKRLKHFFVFFFPLFTFSLQSSTGFPLLPDLSLGYNVVHHDVNHGSSGERQRVRQQRFGQDHSEGPQQAGSWLHHAAQLAVPGRRAAGLEWRFHCHLVVADCSASRLICYEE